MLSSPRLPGVHVKSAQIKTTFAQVTTKEQLLIVTEHNIILHAYTVIISRVIKLVIVFRNTIKHNSSIYLLNIKNTLHS